MTDTKKKLFKSPEEIEQMYKKGELIIPYYRYEFLLRKLREFENPNRGKEIQERLKIIEKREKELINGRRKELVWFFYNIKSLLSERMIKRFKEILHDDILAFSEFFHKYPEAKGRVLQAEELLKEINKP